MMHTISKAWLSLSKAKGFIKTNGNTVVSVLPNVNLSAGDVLIDKGNYYEVQRKKGRPSLGGIILPPLTVDAAIAAKLAKAASHYGITVSALRRKILHDSNF